jgi:DNA polymerase-3 subunit delta
VSDNSDKKTPVIHILQSQDTLALERKLRQWVTGISSDPGTVEMNLSRLDGFSTSEDQLRTTAYSMPFLADHRVVILNRPLARISSDASREKFIRFLEGMPDSTLFVLVLEDEYVPWGKRKGWQEFNDKHWLRQWAKKAESRAIWSELRLPDDREIPAWIKAEVEKQGGTISQAAAVELANHAGNNTLAVAIEIEKLLTYVDRKHAVEVEDVRLLCAPGGETDIFTLIDAITRGDGNRAIHLLHLLLEVEEPAAVFGMIVRQSRLMIQAREILDAGSTMAMVMSELVMGEYAAQKLVEQTRRFNMEQLETIHHRLLQIDVDSKTSVVQLEIALDTFIAGLAR